MTAVDTMAAPKSLISMGPDWLSENFRQIRNGFKQLLPWRVKPRLSCERVLKSGSEKGVNFFVFCLGSLIEKTNSEVVVISEITHEMGTQNAGQINYSAQEVPNIVESVLQKILYHLLAMLVACYCENQHYSRTTLSYACNRENRTWNPKADW